MNVTFNRKLDTGDSKDIILKKGTTYTWGYGYRTDEEIMSNKHSSVGHVTVYFGLSSPTTTGGTTTTD